MDSTDPTDPIDSTDPTELIDNTEPRDPIDNTDAPLPARPDPVPIPPTIGRHHRPASLRSYPAFPRCRSYVPQHDRWW
jgi:hypothetical protein